VGHGLFEGEEAVLHVIERIVAPLGLRVHERRSQQSGAVVEELQQELRVSKATALAVVR